MKGHDIGVLVDTCIWVDFFRGVSETGSIMESLLKDDAVYTTGTVLFELIQGVRQESEKTCIAHELASLHYIEMSRTIWQKAGELSAVLRSKGVSVPVSDILIAAVALEEDLQVFTVDRHFEIIPGVRLFRMS